MIRLWLNYRSPFYIDRLLDDDSIDLSRVRWINYEYDIGCIKLGMNLLTQGYEFSQADMMELKHEGKIKL